MVKVDYETLKFIHDCRIFRTHNLDTLLILSDILSRFNLDDGLLMLLLLLLID